MPIIRHNVLKRSYNYARIRTKIPFTMSLQTVKAALAAECKKRTAVYFGKVNPVLPEASAKAKAAKEAADTAIDSAIARSPSVDQWSSEIGTVEVSMCRGRESLDRSELAKHLTASQLASCVKRGADYRRTSFKPNLAAVLPLAKVG